MKVILLKEIQGLGHAGEIKDVKAGYARNFLFPKGLAFIATKHSLNTLQAQKRKLEKQKIKIEKEKDKLAESINKKEFVLMVKTDEKGSLYAKIDSKAIARELQKNGYQLETQEIIIKEPIKKTGEYKIKLNLGGKEPIITLKVKTEQK